MEELYKRRAALEAVIDYIGGLEDPPIGTYRDVVKDCVRDRIREVY